VEKQTKGQNVKAIHARAHDSGQRCWKRAGGGGTFNRQEITGTLVGVIPELQRPKKRVKYGNTEKGRLDKPKRPDGVVGGGQTEGFGRRKGGTDRRGFH